MPTAAGLTQNERARERRSVEVGGERRAQLGRAFELVSIPLVVDAES
jgi:hypothetical protein